MKYIPLTKGQFAIVDDEDHPELSKVSWQFSSSGYAYRKLDVGPRKITVYLHKCLCETWGSLQVDHINGNKLDNRKTNLRACSDYENRLNKPMAKSNRTGYKGVSFHNAHGKFRSRISINGKQRDIGWFDSAEDAANAYRREAVKLHGEFARF